MQGKSEAPAEGKPGISEQQSTYEDLQGDALDENRSQALGKYRSRLAQQTEQQKQQLAANPQGRPQSGSGSRAGRVAGGGMGGMGGMGLHRQPGQPPGTPPVATATPGTDIDAAPVPIELDEFGEQSESRDDFAANLGDISGTGLGGRGPRLQQGQLISTSGLASLDIDIPQRGVPYRFVTARGELEITAQYVDTTWLTRMAWLAGSLIGIVAMLYAARHIDWTFFDRRLRWIGPLALLGSGVLVILLTSYGLWGLVLLVIGGLLLGRAWLLNNL